MNIPRLPALALLLPLLACASRPIDPGTATDTDDPPDTTGPVDPSTTGSPTTASPTTTAPPDPTTTSTTSPPDPTATTIPPDDTTGAVFVTNFDGGPGGTPCDLFADDCPEGMKCMPVGRNGGNTWDSSKCVPIVPDPDGLYEPCEEIGSLFDGEDTCDAHMMCWNVDPDTGQGTCFGLCTGSPDNPDCADPEAFCSISGDAVLNLCIPTCNPLLQDCKDGDTCIPNTFDSESFLCVVDAGGDQGQVFDVCEFVNVCDPGLLCVNPELAAECDQAQAGCCLPFCDLSLANTCPGKDQECLPWFDQGQAPEDLKNVGVCGLPQ